MRSRTRRRRRLEKMTELARIKNHYMDVFKTAIKQTWAENQASAEAADGDNNCCVLCLGDFQPSDQVTQLSCHRNHVFHHSCMQEMIQRDSQIKRDHGFKCPLCLQQLKFRREASSVIELVQS